MLKEIRYKVCCIEDTWNEDSYQTGISHLQHIWREIPGKRLEPNEGKSELSAG